MFLVYERHFIEKVGIPYEPCFLFIEPHCFSEHDRDGLGDLVDRVEQLLCFCKIVIVHFHSAIRRLTSKIDIYANDPRIRIFDRT